MVTTNYIWHRDAVHAETDTVHSVTTQYSREPDEFGSLLSMMHSGQQNYCHFDAVGSTSELTETSEEVTDTFAYSAFGDVILRTGSVDVSSTWIGRFGYQHDRPEQYYVRRRYFSPQTMHWLSTDPLGISDGVNAYTYVGNSPVRMIDPTGLERIVLCNDGSSQRIPDGLDPSLWCAGRGGVAVVPPKPHKKCVERFASGKPTGKWCLRNNKVKYVEYWASRDFKKGFWYSAAWVRFRICGTATLNDQVICCCPERRVGVRLEADYDATITLKVWSRTSTFKILVLPTYIRILLNLKMAVDLADVAGDVHDEAVRRIGNIIPKVCKSPLDDVKLTVKGGLLKFSTTKPDGDTPSGTKENYVKIGGFDVKDRCI